MRKIILFLCFAILSCMAAWAGSANFYARKGSNTPVGAGKIYFYHPRGGNLEAYKKSGRDCVKISTAPNDVLPETISDEQWTELNSGSSGQTEEDVSVGSNAGDYGGEGIVSQSTAALYVYLFAKPNPGFRFLNWTDQNGNQVVASSDVYTLLSDYANDHANQPSSTWNNGKPYDSSVGYRPNTGEYKDASGNTLYHYVRIVHLMSSNTSAYYYTNFEMIPQTFSFGFTSAWPP